MAIPVREILAVAKFLNSKAGRALINGIKGGDAGDYIDYNGYDSAEDEALRNKNQQEKLDKIREIMVGDPKDYLVRGAAAAATGISDFIGNKAVTDANHLASAILAANRTNSNRQNDIYGPSKKENAANMWAQERLRRGENVKNATDQVSNAIENLAGLYGQRDDVSRAMEAQVVLQAPGNFYNYANSLQRASAQAKKNRGRSK